MKYLAVLFMRAHRPLLIGGTVAIAIAGSRIANDAGDWGSWIALVGGAGILFVADVLAGLEADAGFLVSTTDADRATARLDVYKAGGATYLGALTLLFLVMVLGGPVLYELTT